MEVLLLSLFNLEVFLDCISIKNTFHVHYAIKQEMDTGLGEKGGKKKLVSASSTLHKNISNVAATVFQEVKFQFLLLLKITKYRSKLKIYHRGM